MAPNPVMASKKLVLFGGNGQLGWTFRQHLPAEQLTVIDRQAADLSHPEAIRAAIRAHHPDIILNAAAYTAVDKAQSEPDLAHQINAVAPGVMAEEAQALGACLVHFSTDYVFAGEGTQPYKERDATGPLSVYGQTKLAGEQAVQQACARHLIFRTSWVVGEHGGNFMKTILRLASERDSLRVVADQYGVPTTAHFLVQHGLAAVNHCLQQEAEYQAAPWGVYHLVPAGETTWHAYAQHVIGLAQAHGLALKAKPEDVHPIRTEDYPLPAPRPKNSRLSTEKFQRVFGISLPAWQFTLPPVVASPAGGRQPL
jgi:dTDP-4-dehydrorhamnose reductase